MPTLQLLTTNLDELTRPLSLDSHIEELPWVVRDAITFVKSIGERYLWVDSLCILQNDPSTKHAQIAAMNVIYANAIATLVALGKDAGFGLPGVRPYPKPRQQPLRRAHGVRVMTLLPDLQNVVSSSAWRTRAWTYQEELFSTRLLFFSTSQMYFRCRASTYCEDQHSGAEYHYSVLPVDLDALKPHLSFGLGECTSAYEAWEYMVKDFSTRAFTFDLDRYNAYAGIENELARSLDVPCKYGMPIQGLAGYLYWANYTHQKHETRRLSQLPSWSWCGWAGAVQFPSRVFTASIIDIRFEDDDDNPTRTSDRLPLLRESDSRAVQPPRTGIQPDGPRPLGLVFQATTCNLRLDTSDHAKHGRVSVMTVSNKICGMVSTRHLSLRKVSEIGVTGELIMIGTSQVATTINSSPSIKQLDLAFRWCFDSSESQEDKNAVSLTKVAHQEPWNRTLPRRASTNVAELAESKPSLLWELKWWLRFRGLGGLYGPLVGLTKIILVVIALPFLFAGAAAVVAIAIGALGLALGLAISALIVVPLVIAVILVATAAVQSALNCLMARDEKLCLWNKIRSTPWRKSVKNWTVSHLPMKLQRWSYWPFAWPVPGSITDNASNADMEKPTEPLTELINVMLVSKRSDNSKEECERLAIGVVSAVWWWRSNPQRREVFLR